MPKLLMILRQKQVHIDSHLAIVELIDSYSYKNIFIVRDSNENSEKYSIYILIILMKHS